jgi:hypothetical protein
MKDVLRTNWIKQVAEFLQQIVSFFREESLQQIVSSICSKSGFFWKMPHFSAKHKIFLLTVKDKVRALSPRYNSAGAGHVTLAVHVRFFGEPHVDVT